MWSPCGVFDSDLNQMQSNVFNKKAEWLEAGGGGMKPAFCSDRETAVATLHIMELELSHKLIRAVLNFLTAFTVSSAGWLAHTLSADIHVEMGCWESSGGKWLSQFSQVLQKCKK